MRGRHRQANSSVPGQVNILVRLNTFFKLLWPRTWLAKVRRALAQIADNFWRNYFACGKVSLLAPR